jgi:asparagine synthase (glutamine-hydrolysing)
LTGVTGELNLDHPDPVLLDWRTSDNSRSSKVALPHPAIAAHLTILADVSLHNRHELIEQLGAATKDLDDAGLLLAAYAKWGEDCPRFLLGEFAFAIWDFKLQRLFCCRDQIGFCNFFYVYEKTRFVFASDIALLLACPHVPRKLNLKKFGALAVPGGQHQIHRETFHAGVLSLPSGTSMCVDREGVRQHRYWELNARDGHPYQTKPEALEALRDVLFRAVECRVGTGTRVAALLSGGLDSSAVASVAAKCLEKQNRTLTAISAVLADGQQTLGDERSYIEEFRSWPNIDIRYVTAPGRGPFDFLHDADRFARSPLRISTLYLYEELGKAALDAGGQTLLGGEGGELGATAWSQRYYLELALKGRWPTLARELRSARNTRNISPLRMMGAQILSALLPARGRTPLVLLAPRFQRDNCTRPPFRLPFISERQYQADMIRQWLRKHAAPRRQSATGLIGRSFPLLDKRVLEFCLTLSPSLNIEGGYHRCFIRKALEGILPKRIQWRSGKMPFSPDYFVRYNSQLHVAKDFVESIGPTDPVRSILDIEALKRLCVPVDPRVGSVAARDQVPGTIYAINFLRQFSEFRP